MLRLGRIGEHFVANIAVGHGVLAQAQFLFDHRGQRFHAIGIDLAQLLDSAEDVVELRQQPVELFVAHRDARELGDMTNLFRGHRHCGRVDSGGAIQRQAGPEWQSVR